MHPKNYSRFEGIIFESIQEYLTFSHLKSHFKDEWYNFILPQTAPDKLNWTEIAELVSSEKQDGYTLSYYIPKSLLPLFQEHFYKKGNKKIGSDSYLFITNTQFTDTKGSIEEVNDNSIDDYVKFAKMCFPEWDSSEEYSRYFYNLQKIDKDRFIRNYVYKVDNKAVGCGAITISPTEKLAYFHNVAIIPDERKKGYFTNMIKLFVNVAKDQGAIESSGISEENSPAFFGFKKLGFTVEDIYYLLETT